MSIEDNPESTPERALLPLDTPAAGATQSGTRVEVAPELQERRHKESIPCYQVDPDSGKAAVRLPKVEIQRGTRLFVNKSGMVSSGNREYLPVVECESQPDSEGLYVRQKDVIEAPPGKSSLPVRATDKLNLRLIKRPNKAGKPIMEISGVKLPARTPFRVSSVHKVTDADTGDGVIDTDGSIDYYLISHCPANPSGQGLFVQITAVEAIPEDDYAKSIADIISADDAPVSMRVLVAPKDGGASAFLFKETGPSRSKASAKRRNRKDDELLISKSYADTLPAGTELVVSTSLTISEEKEYYRILEYHPDTYYQGLYVLAKEVTPLLP